MSNVLKIREDLIEVYGKVYAHARRSVTADQELQSVAGLLARRRELEAEKPQYMSIRERAWHNGELDEVRDQIAARTTLGGHTTTEIITEETP